MRLRQLHAHQPPGKINVTPLIDVVMVLIIFYLIVGKMAADRRTRVELPASAVGVQDESPATVILTITAPEGGNAPRILVDGNEVPAAGLAAVLKSSLSSTASTSVQVRADRRLPYSAVSPVIRACREAGLTSIKLVTERSGGAP